MTRGRRIALIVAAVAAAAIAFALARPGADDDKAEPAPATTQEEIATATQEPTTTEPATTEEPATEPETEPPEPEAVTIRVRDGKPVGGVRELTVSKGETVRLVVTSDIDEEVHVHGYDLTKDVGPGKPARFRFPADLEGIFEIELEEAGEPIAELRVEP